VKTILFILQNAYRNDKYKFRNKKEWGRDLDRSYTGKMLKKVIPKNCFYFVINSSPLIGDSATSCFVADLDYMKKEISKINPDIICACGYIAHHGLEHLGIPHYSMPHPAWRAFSNKQAEIIKKDLEKELECH